MEFEEINADKNQDEDIKKINDKYLKVKFGHYKFCLSVWYNPVRNKFFTFAIKNYSNINFFNLIKGYFFVKYIQINAWEH